jgi:RNA polymerase sigma-70 factor (ECF subfamily)
METAPEITAAVARVARDDRGRLLSALIAALGDFQLAEDSLQEALEAALIHWGRSGLPREPRAWLLRVARRRAIDRLRRAGRWQGAPPTSRPSPRPIRRRAPNRRRTFRTNACA